MWRSHPERSVGASGEEVLQWSSFGRRVPVLFDYRQTQTSRQPDMGLAGKKSGWSQTCSYKKGYLFSVFFKHRLSSGEAGDRHAVGRAGNVIETQVMTEFHG